MGIWACEKRAVVLLVVHTCHSTSYMYLNEVDGNTGSGYPIRQIPLYRFLYLPFCSRNYYFRRYPFELQRNLSSCSLVSHFVGTLRLGVRVKSEQSVCVFTLPWKTEKSGVIYREK
ncbi:hypothetical protein BCR39DRAFT_231320 [Naematelia encephala]|uniref:Secreted protein n=1 Tax=Naematelia encephala TaxID=71784 RepID=A0A1Y2BGN8_9TREE|nr:hypothetical protein BCR39DRAFT_231320 [Naematelia encephala]